MRLGAIEWDNESWVEVPVPEPAEKQLDLVLETKKPEASIAAFEAAVVPKNFYEVEKQEEPFWGDASTAPF